MNRLHSRLRMRNGAGWNPLMLFSGGEQGVIYDPNDLNSLFQDSAGTIPVTAAGQPVGRMLDKSGRGNHATQPTAASRPILRLNATTGAYYLETDGVDDFMSTAAIDFTATDKVSIFSGLRKLTDPAEAVFIELSVTWSGNAGTFNVSAPVTSGTLRRFASLARGNAVPGIALGATTTSATYNAPVSVVLSSDHNISADLSTMRLNGSVSDVVNGTADKGTGNFSSNPLYLFRRAGTSLPFTGHFYGLTIVGRLASATEITNVERIFANKTGVVLA